MPTTASHDTLDDAAFEAQLSNFDGSVHSTAGDSSRLPDRFDPLDKAFPSGTAPGLTGNPPEFHPMHAGVEARQNRTPNESRHTRDRIARRTAARPIAIAIAVVIGLAAGATAATFVFYDRASQVLAAWTNP